MTRLLPAVVGIAVAVLLLAWGVSAFLDAALSVSIGGAR